METRLMTLIGSLLVVGHAGISGAQDIQIYKVTWTALAECVPGEEFAVDVFVDARGPSPGDIVVMGTIEGCTPELGPFLSSSVVCDHRPAMDGVVTAEDIFDETNIDTVEFTMIACESGSQTYDGGGGASGSAGAGGSGNGGSGGGDDAGGCACTVKRTGLDSNKLWLGILLFGTLAVGHLRRRRRDRMEQVDRRPRRPTS
jgi:uncharacterized membrane protein YgcG